MKLVAAKVPISTVWTGPDAPRDVDAPATAEQPDVAAWAKSMDRESRLGLHDRTLSQLLFAEPVLVRSERGGWSEISAPWQPSSEDELGYRGWVPSSHLGELPGSATDPVAVTVPTAPLLAEPTVAAPVMTLSFGTVLASIEHTDGYTRVATPDGGSGWLANDVLRAVAEPSTPQDRLRLGAQFLGLEYLWGGTSAYGLDCSGLTHTVSRVLGLRIPRDAHDQADTLEHIPLDEARPGDLYFFARPEKPVHHVGFVSPTGMLHASETGKRLEDEPLPDERRAMLVAAARF
ncbi:NlpC/P60 family protein [Kribbella sp. NPDC056345]|uniref:C40 family peptidase n=1 Tax=Kribbella sp. NPDC056345 TaxID=3345789 RepID=UPI0035D9C752